MIRSDMKARHDHTRKTMSKGSFPTDRTLLQTAPDILIRRYHERRRLQRHLIRAVTDIDAFFYVIGDARDICFVSFVSISGDGACLKRSIGQWCAFEKVPRSYVLVVPLYRVTCDAGLDPRPGDPSKNPTHKRSIEHKYMRKN